MAHAWKACWVQALGGSNPPSSATGPRDLLRFRGFCCLWRRLCCLWCRWCSGRRRARPLCVPLGGGPPASRPRRELRSARRLEAPARPRRRPPAPRQVPPAPSTPAALVLLGLAGPGPATAHRHRGRSLQTSGALRTGGACGAVCTGRQSGAHCAAEPRPRPLRLRDLRRSLCPGARPGHHPLQRASIGAGPSRCSSIRPRTPSR